MLFDLSDMEISSQLVAESLSILNQVGKKRHFGITRWDNIIDEYYYSGVVTIPVKLPTQAFREPFYFVFEKIYDRECISIRPVKGDQRRIGDCFGFFGMHKFIGYKPNTPIFLVEGISDWKVVIKYYPYVLAIYTSGVSLRQLYMLKNMTNQLIIGFDQDEAGDIGMKELEQRTEGWDMNMNRIVPIKDWGAMSEDPFGRESLDKILGNLRNIT